MSTCGRCQYFVLSGNNLNGTNWGLCFVSPPAEDMDSIAVQSNRTGCRFYHIYQPTTTKAPKVSND